MITVRAHRIATGAPVVIYMKDHGLKPDGTVYVSSWEFEGKVLLSEYPAKLPQTAVRRFRWDVDLLTEAGISLVGCEIFERDGWTAILGPVLRMVR